MLEEENAKIVRLAKDDKCFGENVAGKPEYLRAMAIGLRFFNRQSQEY
ncbi:MAG: hypothetical protein ABSD20_03475 [Terriglobales bacterium]